MQMQGVGDYNCKLGKNVGSKVYICGTAIRIETDVFVSQESNRVFE
mgnify:CR=1 FL=1